MPVTYTSRKGLVYTLCQGTTKTGKPRYYFAREPKDQVLDQVPDGYAISERESYASISKPALIQISPLTPGAVSAQPLGADPGYLALAGQGDQSLLVWEDRINSTLDIVAQRLTSYDLPLGEPFTVTVEAGDQVHPALAYLDETARYLAVWLERGADTHELSGQLIAPDNEPAERLVGPPHLIRSNISATLDTPVLAANPAVGEFLAVWVEREAENDTTIHRIMAQRLSAAGTLLGDPTEIVSDTRYLQSPALTVDSNGNYLLLWEQQADACNTVRAVQLPPPLDNWPASFAITPAATCARRPDASFHPERNEYLVAWLEESIYGGERIRAGWLPAGGTTLSDPFALSVTPGERTDNVKVGYQVESGVMVAVWDSYQSGHWQLYLQPVSSAGPIQHFPILVGPEIAFEHLAKSRPVLAPSGLIAWLGAGRQWIQGVTLRGETWLSEPFAERARPSH